MKVWMWQRLYKRLGSQEVEIEIQPYDIWLKYEPREGVHWLCPKPNLVLVDRKHLGGAE